MRAPAATLAALCALAAAGCRPPARELLVEVTTDFPASVMPAYELVLSRGGSPGVVRWSRCFLRVPSSHACDARPAVPADLDAGATTGDPLAGGRVDSHAVLPAGDDVTTPVIAEARALREDGTVILSNAQTVRFQPGVQHVALPLFEVCATLSCPASERCDPSAMCPPGSPPSCWCTSTVDDAGGPDATPDACIPGCGARECGVDACGNPCGACPSGSVCGPDGRCSTACPTVCDDGNPCTTDACFGGACESTPVTDGMPCPGAPCGSCRRGVCTSGGGFCCSESPCRLVAPQCGCAPDQGCYKACVGCGRACASAGSTPVGGSCFAGLGGTTCVPGADCFDFTGGDSRGRCYRYCTSASDCAEGGACAIDVPGEADVFLCSPPCDPFGGGGCDPDESCVPDASAVDGSTYVRCLPTGAGDVGSPCDTSGSSGCARGEACVSSGGPGTMGVCRALCRPDTSFACGASSTCVPWPGFVTTPSGPERVGYCS